MKMMEMSTAGKPAMRRRGMYLCFDTTLYQVRLHVAFDFTLYFSREAIKEDDDGMLEASVAEIIQRAKRKRQAERRPNTRLGMMRHLHIILDSSEAMTDQDLKPTRQLCTAKVVL